MSFARFPFPMSPEPMPHAALDALVSLPPVPTGLRFCTCTTVDGAGESEALVVQVYPQQGHPVHCLFLVVKSRPGEMFPLMSSDFQKAEHQKNLSTMGPYRDASGQKVDRLRYCAEQLAHTATTRWSGWTPPKIGT